MKTPGENRVKEYNPMEYLKVYEYTPPGYEEALLPPRPEGAKEVIHFFKEGHKKAFAERFRSYLWTKKTQGKEPHASLAKRVHLRTLSDKRSLEIIHSAEPPTRERKIVKSTKIKAYPDYLLKLAANAGKAARITLPERKSAENLRFSLYGLRKAIEVELAEDLYPDFMRAVLKIEDRTLIIGPPEESDDVQRLAVEEALAHIEGRPLDHYPTRQPQSKPEPASDPYALYMPPEYHNTEAIDREFESRIDAWLASAPIQDTQHTGDEAEK